MPDVVCLGERLIDLMALNWRPALWAREEQGHLGIKTGLALADVVRVSREEWRLVTGDNDLDRTAAIIHRAEAIQTTALSTDDADERR
jgi:hypothetical protein